LEDQQEVASPPAQVDPTTASSSQTAPPSPTTDAMLSRILDTMLSIQWEVTTMGIRVEQNHINIRCCLKKLDPEDDDKDH